MEGKVKNFLELNDPKTGFDHKLGTISYLQNQEHLETITTRPYQEGIKIYFDNSSFTSETGTVVVGAKVSFEKSVDEDGNELAVNLKVIQ